jgi:hypothetical protein
LILVDCLEFTISYNYFTVDYCRVDMTWRAENQSSQGIVESAGKFQPV